MWLIARTSPDIPFSYILGTVTVTVHTDVSDIPTWLNTCKKKNPCLASSYINCLNNERTINTKE